MVGLGVFEDCGCVVRLKSIWNRIRHRGIEVSHVDRAEMDVR